MEEEEKSFLDEKREKSNKNATKTTQALDNAADIASFTPAAGFAEGYKKFRAIDNAVTGGKLTHLGAKVVNVASPTVKYASKLVGSKPVTAITNVATLPERFVGGKQKPSDKAKTAKSGKSTDASVKGNKSDISKAKSQGQTQTGSSEGSSDGKKSGLINTIFGLFPPLKLILYASIAFIILFILAFVILFNITYEDEEMNTALAIADTVSSKINDTSKNIANIGNYTMSNLFSSDDYDFKQYDKDYTEPSGDEVSSTRNNSKISTMLAWAKNKFTSNIYLRFFNLGNVFSKSSEDCAGEECNNRAEVQFYQKVADISYRYKKLYNIELDWPLIVATVLVRSDDKEQTFSENLNSYTVLELNNTKKTMSLDWEVVYDDLEGYNYLSYADKRYDLQILAKNMVTKTTTQTCSSGDEIVKKTELTDVENSKIEDEKLLYKKTEASKRKDLELEYYLVCAANQKYSIDSTYKLDKEKFENFLDEYIEKRYLLTESESNSLFENEDGSGGGGGNPGAAKGEYGWPLPEGAAKCLSSGFGPRNINVPGASKYHEGHDYPAAGGTPVYAIEDGNVIFAGTNNNCSGNFVKIDHGNGVVSVYMHASLVEVSAGQHVTRGQEIMKVGTTGCSSGNHLHIGINVNGKYVDPTSYIGSLPRCSGA